MSGMFWFVWEELKCIDCIAGYLSLSLEYYFVIKLNQCINQLIFLPYNIVLYIIKNRKCCERLAELKPSSMCK